MRKLELQASMAETVRNQKMDRNKLSKERETDTIS